MGDLHDYWLSNKEENTRSYFCMRSYDDYRLDYLKLRHTLLGEDMGLSTRDYARVFSLGAYYSLVCCFPDACL